MALFRTGNPALTASSFDVPRVHGDAAMTLEGTVNKTGLSLLILLAGAAFTWNQAASPVFIIVGALGGFVVALVTTFKKEWAPVTTPIYALLEGLFLGALSLTFEQRFPGIVVNAAGLTFGILAALLLAYRSGLIKATENFKLGIFAATGGIALVTWCRWDSASSA